MSVTVPLDRYVDVALAIPKGPFTYSVPQSIIKVLKPGIRVRVPFRTTELIGFVVGEGTAPGKKGIKPITEMIDEAPVISQRLMQLAQWMADRYQCSFGEALEHVVPTLIRRGRVPPLVQPAPDRERPRPQFVHTFTDEQRQAFELLESAIARRTFGSFLLQGVTGSGKTEVYLRLIQTTLEQGRAAICMVPEIALTVHLTQFFMEHFREQLAILHSKMTDVESLAVWNRVRSGDVRVVLGPRSAVFSPFEQIGLIILDEEHETSFKQDETPRYHARDVARHLAELHGAVLVMGSATPSLEARYECELGDSTLVRLTARVMDRPMPEVAVIDLKNEIRRGGNLMISIPLRMGLEEVLKHKEQAILFINRRGYSTHITCMDCGESLMCRSCQVAMTYHEEKQKVLCHFCNFTMPVPQTCAACHSTKIKFGGVGTQRVETQIKKMLPAARVERLDTDRVQKKGDAEEILGRFSRGEIDVLIGTQMLAKGFDFPRVTLVGVINADGMLTIPDFHAAERTFQLLTQVAGRTGRGARGGRVIVQTFMPEHYAIMCARHHDYEKFYEIEKAYRKQLNYPPFAAFVNIIIRARKEEKFDKILDVVASDAVRGLIAEGVDVVGPAPLPFYKLRNYFRWHVIVRGTDGRKVHAAASVISGAVAMMRDVMVAVDVDPMSIL